MGKMTTVFVGSHLFIVEKYKLTSKTVCGDSCVINLLALLEKDKNNACHKLCNKVKVTILAADRSANSGLKKNIH